MTNTIAKLVPLIAVLLVSGLVAPANAQPGSGPVALLVQTPAGNPELPPFALLDQYGQVQRYVEPSSGIHLDDYVGQRVRVRHDTGDTLLASQLELGLPNGATTTEGVRPVYFQSEQLPTEPVELQPLESTIDNATSGQTVEPIMLDELPMPAQSRISFPSSGVSSGGISSSASCDSCQLDAATAIMRNPCDTCGRRRCGGCEPAPVSTPRFQFATDLMFLRYHRADGARVGYANVVSSPDAIDFDHEFAPRFSLAYGGSGELGARIRYFYFDHTGGSNTDSSISADVETFDIELFERRRIAQRWTLELSGGLRLVDFRETQNDYSQALAPYVTSNRVDGWGGMVGAELTRSLGSRGNLYARTRFTILQDDHSVDVTTPASTPPAGSIRLDDSTHTISELALGYEFRNQRPSGRVFFARFGYEWQHWTNFTTSFTPMSLAAVPDFTLGSPSDIGFGGFALALGLER